MCSTAFDRIRIIYGVLLSILIFTGACARAAEPGYYPGTTRKVCQITGDWDTSRRMPTPTLTETRAGLVSTDLGSSFEHRGRVWFLFGDSFGRPNGRDTLAWSDSTDPEHFDMTIPTEADGKWLRINVPGISLGGFCVPSYGISVNDTMYIVHTTDWDNSAQNMERSVMARSFDDGVTWENLYDLSAAVDHDMTDAHFINAALDHGDGAAHPELPAELQTGPVVFLWGSGAYRKSNVYLAVAAADAIDQYGAWYFCSGVDGAGVPSWSKTQAAAVPMFNQPDVGEFSVAWIDAVRRWVMLYNSGTPRGINMRTAENAWGPWSGSQVIFDPLADGGYGNMMHWPWSPTERLDIVQDPGRDDEFGGEYGPYIIPRFTEGDASCCTIYYTLSIWNPYAVVLMRSDIGEDARSFNKPTQNTLSVVGDSNWTGAGDGMYQTFTKDNQTWITTFTDAMGDAATGWLVWRLPRDAFNKRLRFKQHGGHGELILLEGGPDLPAPGTMSPGDLYAAIKRNEYGKVLFGVPGHDTNSPDVTTDWRLDPFHSSELKVVVIDHVTDPWGFISVSPMTLTRLRTPIPTEARHWSVY